LLSLKNNPFLQQLGFLIPPKAKRNGRRADVPSVADLPPLPPPFASTAGQQSGAAGHQSAYNSSTNTWMKVRKNRHMFVCSVADPGWLSWILIFFPMPAPKTPKTDKMKVFFNPQKF
jgi:hypothetical protein